MGFVSFDSGIEDSDLNKNLNLLATKMAAGTVMYAQQFATDIRQYAKHNRPWTDRTGMAKATLNTTVTYGGDHIRITLSHGVFYGKYLEWCNGQKYAIIKPTLERYEKIVMRKFQQFFDTLGRRLA